MDIIEDTGKKPVFEADQRRQRQKPLHSGRPGDLPRASSRSIISKPEAKLNTYENDGYEKAVLDQLPQFISSSEIRGYLVFIPDHSPILFLIAILSFSSIHIKSFKKTN